MKATILIDNNTKDSLVPEWGLSVWIMQTAAFCLTPIMTIRMGWLPFLSAMIMRHFIFEKGQGRTATGKKIRYFTIISGSIKAI